MLPGMGVCPICGRPVTPHAQDVTGPFCSPRCKQIDLGKWLAEEYRVPAYVEPGTDESQLAVMQAEEKA